MSLPLLKIPESAAPLQPLFSVCSVCGDMLCFPPPRYSTGTSKVNANTGREARRLGTQACSFPEVFPLSGFKRRLAYHFWVRYLRWRSSAIRP